ncbi:transport protein [Nitzschia inconspicua]|uniref:Transport protein n=2 Tax=Nitzschia inconspicua TaxID=303405 RepID=A0A9K3K8F8_9STRA|nr:transport protein [Nitzschia inconspicua]
MSFSQVPGAPTFRSSAINAVAVVPLLSSDHQGQDDLNTNSSRSFHDLMALLQRYNQNSGNHLGTINGRNSSDGTVLVVPYSNLTQPGDFKYSTTPLRNFHWGHGCQRLQIFDGRPYHSRMAHDRLINHQLTRDWIDLCPSRRTAALIGVLNMRDCPDEATLQQAIQEWQQWAERYSTPPYEVTAHGRDFERDFVIKRLFVFDSFHESNRVDLTAQTKSLGSTFVAFPPDMECDNGQVMDLHINVVINDLAVAVFQDLEGKIKASDAVIQGNDDGQPLASSAAKSRFSLGLIKSGSSTEEKDEKEDAAPTGSTGLSINNLASVVSSNSKLASPPKDPKSKRTPSSSSSQGKLQTVVKGSSSEAQLLTPLDEFWDYSELAPKDAHEMMKREVARREKFAADLSLLAGSPLDAYERYTKAADMSKTSCPDPLWYASALEGCAAAHIAMSDVGGFNVDEYLESSFQLPDEIMACAVIPTADKATTKQNLPRVVFALCEDALDVTSRHPKASCFNAELLLKLAWYAAELEDAHERCLWGLGEGCYGGEESNDKRRWQMASATQLNFLELKNKDGEDVIKKNTFQRLRKWTDCLHMACSTGALEPVTRADVSLRCASLCMRGLRPTVKPTLPQRSEKRVQCRRKAAFFVVAAAEAMSDATPDTSNERANALWVRASKLLSKRGNKLHTGNYGWATLRAVTLHALVIQGLGEESDEAAIQLLSLMSEISPPEPSKGDLKSLSLESLKERGEGSKSMDDSARSDSYMDNAPYSIAEARSYVRERAKEVAKDARARSKELFSGQNTPSSLLVVAQSKWVDDDPIPAVQLPMAEFSSDFSNKILALRSVWSAIKYEDCALAQRMLIGQISDLRRSRPASSLTNMSAARRRGELPVKITSIKVVGSDPSTKFERVKIRQKVEQKDNAMATFFNPYASKSSEKQSTIVPLHEEQFVSVTFDNRLSIPFEIASCKLEFDVDHSDQVKAPAISFVIPGQTKNFAVKFPFIVLENPSKAGNVSVTVKGIHVTALSRSLFLKIKQPQDENEKMESSHNRNTPLSSSLYPRRDYNKTSKCKDEAIISPLLEIVPPQPILQVCFASSPTPVEEDTIIPAPISDGEIFTLPKLCLWNDPGQSGNGTIEELQISALGLPGVSEVLLFDLSGSKANKKNQKSRSEESAAALTILATCVGVDKTTLNGSQRNDSSYVSLQLCAATDMGAVVSSCNVTLRIRYRGKPASSTLEVWRKREIEVRILRIKGPRISSLSFRSDLFWNAAYTNMSRAFSERKAGRTFKRTIAETDLPTFGSTDDEDFVVNRLGQDSGVHACGDGVVVILSVANETSSDIKLSRPDGSDFGFEGSTISTLKILPGVSAKVPMVLPRLERGTGICEQLIALTRLNWEADVSDNEGDGMGSSGGPMIPINRRVRKGSLEIPSVCLKNIVDENPVFLSRICKAPCTISVRAKAASDSGIVVKTEKLKPVDLSVNVEVASWLSKNLLDDTKLTLEFCCAKIDLDGERLAPKSHVWIGQIRKALLPGKPSFKHPHSARILFLNEGTYNISACVSFSRTGDSEDVAEVWWAEKAITVQVLHCIDEKTS